MNKPISITSLIESLISDKGWKIRFELHKVFAFWNDLVGQDIARQAQPYVIHKTILWIRVSDSVWMQQLHLLKEMLLAKINARLHKAKFSDLRFQLDSSLGSSVTEIMEVKATQRLSPSAESKQIFESLLVSIDDEELKAAIRQCWLKTSLVHDNKEQGGVDL